MIAVLTAFLAILTLLYVAGIAWLTRGVRSVLRVQGKSKDRPLVSVVVAARNEEASIGGCLDAVLASDYPHYEVVVVDDGSTDSTADVVAIAASESEARVRLITPDPAFEGQGKVAAITRGVEVARGEIIVTLDADCRVGRGWLGAMLSFMTPDVGFVAGPVAYERHDSVFRGVEALEFMSLIGVAAGAIGQGRPLICNSANAAYRRFLFEDMMSRLPPAHLPSADELLMNFVHQETAYGVAFCSSPDALVTTQGAGSVARFVRQRMRWVRIVPHLPRGHRLALVAAYLFLLIIALSLLAGPWSLTLAVAGSTAFVAKSLIDAQLLREMCRRFGMEDLLRLTLFAEVLYLPYVLLTAPAGMLTPTEWKGRVPSPRDRSSSMPVSVET